MTSCSWLLQFGRTLGRTRGGGGGEGSCLHPVIIFEFFLDEKISTPDVFSCYLFNPRAHFEASLVMSVSMVTRYDVISSRWSSHF